MRRGLLGGTFDPVHRGHLHAAREIAQAAKLEKILLIPAGMPWQKSDRKISPADDRLAMLSIAVAGDPLFDVSDIDVRRTGPTYTFDMITELKELYPNDELVLIIGSDIVPRLNSWHRYQEVISMIEIIVCTRPEFPLDLSSLPDGRFTIIDVRALPVSSSGVRAMIHNGLDAADMLPQGVMDYITDHDLYLEQPVSQPRPEEYRL